MCAVHAGNYDMAKLLLDRGASANFSRGKASPYPPITGDIVG